MPRYEFQDGKSQKFWEIHCADDTFTVRFGRIGTDGQTSTKVFSDAAKAEKEAEKLIQSKVKKGYREVEAGETPILEEPGEDRNPELEIAILENPSDPQAWTVFGDWLQTIGDARGELIHLGLQGPNPQIEARIQEIQEAHGKSWISGDLAKLLAKGEEQDDWNEVWRATWLHGFLVEARVGTVWEWTGPKPLELLRVLLRDPSSRFLHTLAIGLLDPEDYEGHLASAILTLTKAGKLPALRNLHIGDFEYPDHTEISWTDVGDVSRVYPVAPNLESLHVQGGGIELGSLRHAKLKKLKLETGGLPEAAVRSVAAADLPALEDLEMWLGDENYGAGANLPLLEPILAGKRFPKLRRLGLMNSELANEIAEALPDSNILARVEEVDLSMGTLTDPGAQHLLDKADKFRHLKRLNLSENFLSAEMQAPLTAAFGSKVQIGSQEAPDVDDGEVWTYVSVSE